MESAWGVAALTGIAIGMQVAVIGTASQSTHPLLISLALQAAGVLCGLVWVVHRGGWGELADLGTRWWLLPLGLLGWGIVAALGYAASQLGAGPTLAVVVGAQVATALVFDMAGGLRLDLRHVLGLVLLVAGVTLIAARS